MSNDKIMFHTNHGFSYARFFNFDVSLKAVPTILFAHFFGKYEFAYISGHVISVRTTNFCKSILLQWKNIIRNLK